MPDSRYQGAAPPATPFDLLLIMPAGMALPLTAGSESRSLSIDQP